jgi:sialidase-1
MKMRIVLLLAAAGALAAADPAVMELYSAGTGGYHTYRIPALLATGKGTLLAFCEGRKMSGSDAGDIDLMVRRSRDGGKTWSPAAVVYEEGGDAPITIGNPAPVQDRRTGVVHLLFTRNNQRLFATSSRDEGRTWKAPLEITESLRPFPFAWARVGAGPGHAIQLRGGRLLVPVWLNDRIRGNYRSAAVYSDDGGKTWKTGGIVPAAMPDFNECMFRERGDGAVEVTLRSRAHHRYSSLSRDGGATWGEPKAMEGLPDPVCQASTLSLGGRRAVFANAADDKRRANFTVRASDDDGGTWAWAKPLHAGPTAYSDLARGRRGEILALFEAGEKTPYQSIRFARIPKGWWER